MSEGIGTEKRITASELLCEGSFSNCSYKFSSDKISEESISSSHPLRCRDLTDHHRDDGANIGEFSDDSSLFISGGQDGRVLLWSTTKTADENWTPEPTEMNKNTKIVKSTAWP